MQTRQHSYSGAVNCGPIGNEPS